MTTHPIGRIVAGCLAAGLVVALGLVVGPLGGAQEHVITGTVLLTFAASWALLAVLSQRRASQPQRLGGDAGRLHGSGRRRCAGLRAERRGARRAWVDLAAPLPGPSRGDGRSRAPATCTAAAGRGSSTRCSAVYAVCAIGGGYQTIRESRRPSRHPAPGQMVDVGGHRLHLDCAGSGTPTVILESGLGETGDYWGGSRRRSRRTRRCAPTTARVEAGAIRRARAAGWGRGGARPSHAARSRARSWSVGAGRPFDGGAVRQDLRRPLSRSRSREWCCSTVNRPKHWRVFRLTRPSTTSSVAPLACSRRWRDSAWRDCSTPPVMTACRPRRVDRLRLTHRRRDCSAALRDEFARAADVARAGPLVPEPGRPAADRRHRDAGRHDRVAAAAGGDGGPVNQQPARDGPLRTC